MSARLRALVLGAAAGALALPHGSLVAQPAAAGAPADPRVPLGITIGTSGSSRDTLGLLVVAVVPQSVADRAGVVEGSRVASINGVRLRLTPGEVGEPATRDALVRRFDQEVQSTRPGEPVVLEVIGGGRRQTVSMPLGGAGAPTVLSTTALSTTALPAGPATASPAASAAPAVPEPATVAPATAASSIAPGTAAPPLPAAPADPHLLTIDSAHAATLGTVIDRMGELQQQLHRLARDQRSLALADTLSDAEEDLATLRHRLRGAAARQARSDSTHDVGLPGLRLAAVNDELAAYFGEGSVRGLLVVQAEAAWDPIRTGDVVLRVDGAPADAERLRAAFDPRRRSTIELLRRRRVLTVTLHGRAAG